LDELTRLEEKIQRMIALINELRQRIEDLEAENSQHKEQEREVKKRVDNLINKVDNLSV
jgi:FtsZ-binding cell division protein ZapB